MNRRRIAILVLIVAASVIIAAVLIVRRIERQVYQAYALMSTNYLIIDYVCRHENQWPRGWDDLIPGAGRFGTATDPAEIIAGLREVVGVNWDLDLEALLATPEDADRSAFRTTYLLSGSEARWQDPTEQIYSGIHQQWRLGESEPATRDVE